MIQKKGPVGSTFKFGVAILFLALLASTAYLLIRVNSASRNTPLKTQTTASARTTDEKPTEWQTYTNEKFGFYIKYPRLLYKRELGQIGGYLSFTRFEENKFSSGHGLAVGVRESSLEAEVEQIKKEFEKLGGARLIHEQKIVFNGINGAKLYYKPEKGDDGEERVVVILNNDKYSYSISTVPEQIGKILEEFGFIE